MAENSKRYYWLKLKDDFFDEKYIKALRKLPQGDSLAIVYLKMQLKSLKTEGIIKYEGIMPDAMTELALLLDEDENVVRLAVEALIRFGVVERWDNDTFYLVQLQQLIGSESQSAARVRKHRELKKTQQLVGAENSNTQPMLQCNADVTECNTEIEKSESEDIESREKSEEQEQKKEKKSRYGTFNNVLLTPTELATLQSEFSNYLEAIEYLSEYIESTGKKYKSHYMTMRRWVFDALKEKQIKQKELEQREARANSKKPSAYAQSGNPFLDIAREEGIFDGGDF